MDDWHLVALSGLVASPWRNGGGTTRDIASGAGWRLSLARIDRDGPFSAYPGLERAFALVGGEVSLGLDAAARRVGPTSAPIAFDGEAAPACTLHGELPAAALNLMCERGVARGSLARVGIAPGGVFDVPDAPGAPASLAPARADGVALLALHVQAGSLVLAGRVAGPGDTWLLAAPARAAASEAPGAPADAHGSPAAGPRAGLAGATLLVARVVPRRR